MISAVVAWSARHHRIVFAAAVLLALAGERARRTLARDVLPDLSDPQIVLVASWMGHSATDVATLVTGPVTAAMNGISGTTAVRGSSMPGMAYVDVVFAASANLSAGRAAIIARLAEARASLPATVRIQRPPAPAGVFSTC